MGKKGIYRSERDAWRDLRLAKAKHTRQVLNALFKKMFVGGHNCSIKPLVECLTIREELEKCKKLNRGRFLEDIHPDAFEFIVRYGESYRPKYFRKPPKVEPRPHECFGNAHQLMLAKNNRWRHSFNEAYYVEGVILGAVCDPMLHGWNTSSCDPRKCVDWTFYSGTHWIRYFGIPFSEEDYRRLLREAFPDENGYGIVALFGKTHFVKLRPHLEALLAERHNYEVTQGTA